MGTQEIVSRGGIQRQLDQLPHLLAPYKDRVGDWKGIPIVDMGVVFRCGNISPRSGADWLMLDFDGTLAATDKLKAKRKDGYKTYALNRGVKLGDTDLDDIMQTTYEFSKWAEREGGSTVVHARAQMGALTWLTDQLLEGVSLDTVKHTVTRIHKQLHGEKNRQQSDPFYFRSEDNALVFTSSPPWAKELEQLFVQTMQETPVHEQLVAAARTLGDPTNPNRLNIGVFTSGSKDQISKVASFLAEYDIPVSQIWWTWVPKGEFNQAVINSGVANSEQDPLGPHEHVVIMVDDSKEQLASIKASNVLIKQKTGGSFVCVEYGGTGIGPQTSSEEIVSTFQGMRDKKNARRPAIVSAPRKVAGVEFKAA